MPASGRRQDHASRDAQDDSADFGAWIFKAISPPATVSDVIRSLSLEEEAVLTLELFTSKP